MTLATLDDLVAGLAGGQARSFVKASQTAEGAGTWHSLWKAAGSPAAGSNPGSANGAIPTDATTGAFAFTNPTGGDLTYLAQMLACGTVQGTLILYDRLWHNSTLVGNVNTSQGITQPSLTRHTDGVGVELWGEIYTAIGATGATLTVTYTDQGGTGSNSATYAHPANAESVGQMFPLVLAAGDTGVRSVSAAQWSVSTGTAGDFGLTLAYPIARIPLNNPNVSAIFDAFALGLPQVADDACLALMVQCTTTSTGNIAGSLTLAQG